MARDKHLPPIFRGINILQNSMKLVRCTQLWLPARGHSRVPFIHDVASRPTSCGQHLLTAPTAPGLYMLPKAFIMSAPTITHSAVAAASANSTVCCRCGFPSTTARRLQPPLPSGAKTRSRPGRVTVTVPARDDAIAVARPAKRVTESRPLAPRSLDESIGSQGALRVVARGA